MNWFKMFYGYIYIYNKISAAFLLNGHSSLRSK